MLFLNKNKKNIIKLFSVIIILIFLVPVLSYAKLVTCNGSVENPCDFDAFVGMINTIINWISSIDKMTTVRIFKSGTSRYNSICHISRRRAKKTNIIKFFISWFWSTKTNIVSVVYLIRKYSVIYIIRLDNKFTSIFA